MLVTPHDQLHKPTDHPHWSESAWFAFHIPERGIGGWIYMNHRLNMNLTVGGVGIFDDSGDKTWNCLFHDWNDRLPLAPDAKMFDYQAENSLTLKCVAPCEKYEVSYHAEGLDLDLTWTARFDPFLSGLPEGMQDWASGGDETGHFEQGGRMTGTITLASLGGETLTVDCLSVRDRSWGPRAITPDTPRGANPWAAGENSSFFINAFATVPASEDPVDGTTERVVSGHFWSDGKLSNLENGTYRCTERDEQGRPVRVVIEATDTLGRDFHAEAHAKTWLTWPAGYPHTFVWWSLADWTINGEQAWGNVIEWYPTQLIRRWTRERESAATPQLAQA